MKNTVQTARNANSDVQAMLPAPPNYSFLTTRAAPPPAPFAERITSAIPLDPATGVFLPLTGGSDELAWLSVADFVGELFPPEAGLTVQRYGLQAFESAAEPACLAIRDILIHPEPDPEIESPPFPVPDPCAPCPAAALPAPLRARQPLQFSEAAILQVRQALMEHCQNRRDPMTQLDPRLETADEAARGLFLVQVGRAQFDSRYADFCMPWLQVSDPLFPRESRAIPPLGHVSGRSALADTSEHLHHAPVNRDLQ